MWIKTLSALLLLVGLVKCLPEGRVVNGTDTDIRKFPFMASLRFQGIHTCGCSIIAPSWILTAAHCVYMLPYHFFSIEYAVTDIKGGSTNVAPITGYITHEKYNPLKNLANDIALLKLYGRLIFNFKTITSVNLPVQGYEIPQLTQGAQGVLIGWGLNASATDGGIAQRTLQEVDLKIYSDEECNKRHNGKTTKDQICGGVDEGGKGQCTYDSGGPLLHKTSEGYIQVGIVSWSVKPCTIYPYPGVYTKVSHYIQWIQKYAQI